MSDVKSVLQSAQDRARKLGLPYEGALTPAEAHLVMQAMPDAKLVDVRSRAELDFVGRVPGSAEIEFKTYPGMRPNAAFAQQLTDQVPAGTTAMFLCRSGGRSHEAAVIAHDAGYDAYNVLEGFEGDLDPGGHRNTVGGWRAAGLPWRQS